MMSRIVVDCLGSGAALSKRRRWSSLLLDGRVVLGLPPTAVPELYRLGAAPAGIERVFISHLHADHYFGLPFLLLPLRLGASRREPLVVIGPQGIVDATEELCRLAWPGIHERGGLAKLPVRFVEIAREGPGEAGGQPFEAIRTQHFEMLSFGFRFRHGGRTVAYTGDTGECDALDRFLDGIDLLMTEFTHTEPCACEDKGHLCADSIRRLADQLRPRGVPILATHMTGEPPPIDGVTMAEDGARYVF